MTRYDPNRGAPDALLLIWAWLCAAAPYLAMLLIVLLALASVVLVTAMAGY